MTSYFALAGVVEAFWELRDKAPYLSAEELGSHTARTGRQTEVLLSSLQASGMVEAENGEWGLSTRGVSWATDLAAASEATQVESRRNFRNFTDYHPKEWWPDGK